MRTIVLIIGVICVLLGGLWLLQGLGLVHLRPILCFADCETVQGASPVWVVAGLVVLLAGGLATAWALKQHPSSNRNTG